MTLNIQNGQGIQALDVEAILNWIRGDTIVSGCAPSTGSGNLEVDVASGGVVKSGFGRMWVIQPQPHNSCAAWVRYD